ncbi:MAG: hypothetical protein IPM39_12790, partial [Chloroflexi bacterium]|nr:hypothetical protein [Chloroflexota bacterium]
LVGCGGPPASTTVLPTSAAAAVIETAVPTQAAPIAETILPTAPSEPVVAAAAAERPLLPRFDGGMMDASQPGSVAVGALAAAVFSLNATLPETPAETAVLAAAAMPFTGEQAQQLAARLGFGGPVYTEVFPEIGQATANLPAEAAAPPQLIQTFYLFDGPRVLNVTESAAFYTDNSVAFDYLNPLPFDQAAPIAEVFLQERGLLDFAYALRPGWGEEVFVVRLVDGRAASQPEISVGVGGGGQVAFATYQMLQPPAALGSYPLISAAAAWQHLQDGVTADIVTTIVTSSATAPPADTGGFQYWPRQQQSGPDVHLYAWPAVYAPISGAGPPRIHVLNYGLQADEATLAAMAGQVGQTIHVWGSLDTGMNTLAVAGWEPAPQLNPLFKAGVIQRAAGQTRLQDGQSGETFILPDVPADVPEGAAVNVFAWAARQTGQAFPVLDWEGIDMQMAAGGETAVSPPTANAPYSQITIDRVELAYHITATGEESAPGWLWQPVWAFYAAADNGDRLTFYVQAVDGAFLRP